jgi:hypothetical protein
VEEFAMRWSAGQQQPTERDPEILRKGRENYWNHGKNRTSPRSGRLRAQKLGLGTKYDPIDWYTIGLGTLRFIVRIHSVTYRAADCVAVFGYFKAPSTCNYGYAMTSTSNFESSLAIFETGWLIQLLSPQSVLDCSILQGNDGCNGGFADQGWQWMASVHPHGTCMDEAYPWVGTQGVRACDVI